MENARPTGAKRPDRRHGICSRDGLSSCIGTKAYLNRLHGGHEVTGSAQPDHGER
jgi:hypothetical protein